MGVEPTKLTAATPGWARSASTAALSPWTTLNTPSGQPASLSHSASIIEAEGSFSEGYENGYFIGPCLFDRVTPEMRIYKEEIFGPVLSVVRAPDYDSAVRMADDHEFGNGVAIFTRDGDAAREFANRVEIGMVGVNVPIPVPVAYHSFGGWKRSLFGDHAMHGMEGVRFYTRLKTVTSRWPTGIRAGVDLSFPMTS